MLRLKTTPTPKIGGETFDISGVGTGTGGGRTIVWDSAQNKWVTSETGSVGLVSAGVGLNGGDITTVGTLSVDVGTTANKILQLDTLARIPAVDGSLLANVNATKLQSYGVAAIATYCATGFKLERALYIMGTRNSVWWDNHRPLLEMLWLRAVVRVTATIQADAVTSAKINSTGVLPNRLLITDATTGASVGYANCSLGEVLQWGASGWACQPISSMLGNVNASIGTYGNSTQVPQVTVDAQGRVVDLTNVNIAFPVVSVNGRTGVVDLIPSDITGLGTAAVEDVGTGVGDVLQFATAGQLPALDGSLLTNVNGNATKIQSRAVAATAPVGGQVLGWNALSSEWEPLSAAVGSVTSITGGAGLLGGTINSSGTLSVDVGTSANQILQLNASGLIPAVDGSLLTNLNATRIGTRTVATAAPTAGQVLGFNSGTGEWEPSSVTSGTVTNIETSTGLLGGPISNTGTLSVDVGTGANQILQLNASALIPAVDGSLLTNVNSTKLQTRAVSANLPSDGQVLGYNALLSQWEPSSVTSGTVTTVNSGVGLTGGPISSNGTLNVDVGTSANQILQLNASGLIPAVDGSLLTNLNATRIGTRTVATAAPTAGQVLGYNSGTGEWEPSSVTSGTVTNIETSTGLLGGPISNTGTLSVDVGTSANQILQLNASALIPAVDGSLLTNVNSTKLQTRTVSASLPSDGQVLGYNALLSQWEPSSVTLGTVTTVNSGVGLTGGPISSNGTLNVDVGTSANQILQLNASALIPAVDGSLLTNLNATRIGTRTVATAAPTAGQVLGFNSGTGEWEPSS